MKDVAESEVRTSMLPPCERAISDTMNRPRPRPSRDTFTAPRQKGLNSWRLTSSGMRGPAFVTVSWNTPSLLPRRHLDRPQRIAMHQRVVEQVRQHLPIRPRSHSRVGMGCSRASIRRSGWRPRSSSMTCEGQVQPVLAAQFEGDAAAHASAREVDHVVDQRRNAVRRCVRYGRAGPASRCPAPCACRLPPPSGSIRAACAGRGRARR
jgi:hypothetical protein